MRAVLVVVGIWGSKINRPGVLEALWGLVGCWRVFGRRMVAGVGERDFAERRGGGRAASRRPLAGRRPDGSIRMMASTERGLKRSGQSTALLFVRRQCTGDYFNFPISQYMIVTTNTMITRNTKLHLICVGNIVQKWY